MATFLVVIMKRILLSITVVLLSNYAVEATSYVLAVKGQDNESVKTYPNYAVCIKAKQNKLKKDKRPWDCFIVDYN